MSSRTFDVVVVPFPFTDNAATKIRPALVLSAEQFQLRIGHVVLAMITSLENRGWPLDVEIRNLREAGLPHASIVRMKLFTLDERLIRSTAGRLGHADQEAVGKALALLFPR